MHPHEKHRALLDWLLTDLLEAVSGGKTQLQTQSPEHRRN